MKKAVTQSNQEQEKPKVYLLYGDEFLVRERVQAMLDDLLDAQLRSTNLIILDGANLDLSELAAQLFTPSLFPGPRLILVDQTTLFMGRADQGKMLAKVVESWRSGDRKTAFRAFGQLMSLAGIGSEEIERGPEFLLDALGDSAEGTEKEIVAEIAQEFAAEGLRIQAASQEGLLEEIVQSSFPEGTTLVMTAPAVDRRKKVFKALEKRGVVLECSPKQEKYGSGLERSFFEERVRADLAKSGKTISAHAMEKMYTRSGKDLRRLHSEIEKLIGYLGTRKEVTETDVEALFSDFHEAAFFELNSALRTADLAKCLPALHENLKIVSHPLQTLSAMANEVRRLMAARELLFTVFRKSWKPGMTFPTFKALLMRIRQERPELIKKGKFQLISMNEYALYLYLKDAQKFTMERLVRVMEALFEADVRMKSTRLGARAPRVLLEQVLLTLCSPHEPGSAGRHHSPAPNRFNIDKKRPPI